MVGTRHVMAHMDEHLRYGVEFDFDVGGYDGC